MKIALAAALVITSVFGIPATTTDAAPMPACAYEDGSGSQLPCIWEADKRGNGIGTTVVITSSECGVEFYDDGSFLDTCAELLWDE